MLHHWTPEEDARLRESWGRGKSAREIGRDFNMTRNAIIGRVHRLKLDARPSPIIRASDPKPKRVRIRPSVAPKAPIVILPHPVFTAPKPKRSMAQDEVSRLPIGKKMDIRRPALAFPDQDEIQRHIAQYGVVLCPTAAADVTSGFIPPSDSAAIAAHEEWRQNDYLATKGASFRRSGERGAAANRKRREDAA